MTNPRLTRRSAIALAVAGLAGCTTSFGDEEADDDGTDIDDSRSDHESSPEGREEHIPDRDIEPDWESAAPFRSWLLFDTPVDGGNRRFDYTEQFPDTVDLEGVLPEFTGLGLEEVDGHLVQGFTQVFFGSFDPEAITDAAADAETAEFDDIYEGYAVITETLPDETTRTVAVGTDAIVIGDDYEARIDANLGYGDRLEDVDPEFTHLFEQFPHETTITGEYDAPAGVLEMPEIYLWGVSSESPTAEEMTWVFIFEDEADLSEETLSDLEAVAGDVLEADREGRTATIVGAAPEIDEEMAPGESD